jgi:hypothetical protein
VEIDDLLEAAENDAPPTIGETVAESSDATLADEDAAASESEADNLLEAAQDEPAAAEGADAAPEGENAAASESEVDDLLEVAQDGGAGAEQESAADAEPKEEANPLDGGAPAAEESTEKSDDPLSAFGEVEEESEIGDLLKGLEEVSAEELVTELREIRAMLPQIEEGQEEA